MGWFFKKKNNLPAPIEDCEVPAQQDYTPVKSREDIEFEDRMAQNAFERDLAVGKLQAGVAAFQQGMQTVDKVTDVWKYSKMVEQNIAQIQGATAVELARISAKFQNQQSALEGIFGQRQQGLSGQFAVLEKAMKENDRELLIASLKGISTIVTSSPLEDFEKLAKAWEDTSKPLELDF
ncbi:MAG: hypothetical protein J1F12_06310 [Muribaculaceae bacterium]|nr:hypothetical protein [Muribaculaceae bacterium]